MLLSETFETMRTYPANFYLFKVITETLQKGVKYVQS